MKAFIIVLALVFFVFVIITSSIYSTDKPAYNKQRGEELFVQQCSKCHRKNGKGIKRVYPPVKDADYIRNASSEELLRGMLFGRSGKIVVNGETYSGVMTTEIDKNLSDDDIANILNYVYNELNGIKKIVTSSDVQKARKAGKLPEHK